jgi:hypothetical protein
MGETSAHIPVNWEAIKVLAIAVGVREAARRMGLSEEAVKRRCTREGWLKDPEVREAASQAVKMRTQSTLVPKVSPMQALAAEITALGAESRLGFARAIHGVAKHVSQRDPEENLADAQNVRASAQTANLVHGWQDASPQVRLRLDVLGGAKAEDAPTIDVEADVTWSEGESQGENDL